MILRVLRACTCSRFFRRVFATASFRWSLPTYLAGPIFLTSRIPIRPFQVDFTIFTEASMYRDGASFGGFPDIGWLPGPAQATSSISVFGTQSGNFGLTPPGYSVSGRHYDRYGQCYSSFPYQLTRRSPSFPLRGSLYVASGSGHNSQSRAHTRLFERDSTSWYHWRHLKIRDRWR